MGLFQKRMARKEKRNQMKYGKNPVTGETFNKRTFKMYQKNGIKDDGTLLSKYDASNRKTRRIRSEGRIEVRKGRNEVKMGRNAVKITRSNNGNTLGETTFGPMMESIGNIFGGMFGGGQQEAENIDYTEE